jgi:hypothetical protein
MYHLVAVPETELERKMTPLSDALHREHQGIFFKERAKGFWMKLAVVSWTVSHP